MEFAQLHVLGLRHFFFERLKVALVAEVEVLPQKVEERFEHREVDVLNDGCWVCPIIPYIVLQATTSMIFGISKQWIESFKY